MTTFCPHALRNSSATRRVMRSVVPPAVKPTTIVTARFGYVDCAWDVPIIVSSSTRKLKTTRMGNSLSLRRSVAKGRVHAVQLFQQRRPFENAEPAPHAGLVLPPRSLDDLQRRQAELGVAGQRRDLHLARTLEPEH